MEYLRWWNVLELCLVFLKFVLNCSDTQKDNMMLQLVVLAWQWAVRPVLQQQLQSPVEHVQHQNPHSNGNADDDVDGDATGVEDDAAGSEDDAVSSTDDAIGDAEDVKTTSRHRIFKKTSITAGVDKGNIDSVKKSSFFKVGVIFLNGKTVS